MKEKRFSKGLRRTISGSLAVVLAATAIGPLFTVMSHAESFDYIEELKNLKNGSSFSIMEIVPDGSRPPWATLPQAMSHWTNSLSMPALLKDGKRRTVPPICPLFIPTFPARGL